MRVREKEKGYILNIFDQLIYAFAFIYVIYKIQFDYKSDYTQFSSLKKALLVLSTLRFISESKYFPITQKNQIHLAL